MIRAGEAIDCEPNDTRVEPVTARMLLDPATRTALVIAHPGHELRVHAWLRKVRPTVFVLTTGSRSGEGRTRLAASRDAIAEAGAAVVTDWGCLPDRDLYRCILEGRVAEIVTRTHALAAEFVRRDIQLVVTDSHQFYNVAHDLTHVMARSAARRAARILSRGLPVLDYPVVPHALVAAVPHGEVVACLALRPEQVAFKEALVRSMPDLTGDFDSVVAAEGPDALAEERFTQPPPLEHLLSAPGFRPYYESYGEARVREGTYDHVIRWTHMEPFLRALA